MSGHVPALRGELPNWLAPAATRRLEHVLVLHRAAARDLRVFVARVVLAGMQLRALKREIGHGRWCILLEDVLIPQLGVSESHLRRYMAVAEAARRVLAQRGLDNVVSLLDLGEADQAALDVVGEAVGGVTAASTWQEMLADFGLAKVQERGGFHPPRALLDEFAKANGLPVPGVYADWTADVQERFREWLKAEGEAAADADREGRELAKATRRWTPLVSLAAQADRHRHQLGVLPKPTRVAMRDTLRRVLEAVEQSLEEARA